MSNSTGVNRDKECFGFTQEDINNFITNLCTK